jgi:signal transduction histidine kinase
VDDFSSRTRIATTVDVGGVTHRLPPDVEVVIYRVVQESLTNVAKHANASQVSVHLAIDDRAAALTVEDDGRGMGTRGGRGGRAGGNGAEVMEDGPHLGLLGMRERITAVGGTLTIGPGAAGGVRVTARIPIGATA